MTVKNMSKLKPAVSVTAMAKMLDLSRSRMYQLLDLGILPQPLYCIRTKRPFYTRELQQKCLEVKDSNIGINGQYILFYEKREKISSPRKKKTKTAPLAKEFKEALETMGLDCSQKEVSKKLSSLYPNGIANTNKGMVIRELFRKLKSN